MREILKEMLKVPTTSGAEDRMREYLVGKIGEKFDEYQTDSFGNLIMHKQSAEKHILLCAGLDDYGVIASFADGGSINISPLGNLAGKDIVNRVCKFFSGVSAIITSPDGGTEPKVTDCVAFAGEFDQGKNAVSLGDKAVFDTSATELYGGVLSGFGISSRVGAAVITKAVLDNSFPSDCSITVVFYAKSKQDDRGLAASVSACIEKYGCVDFAAIIDAHDVCDGCKFGDGLALRLISKRYVCESNALDRVKAYFERNNSALQFLSDNASECPAQAISNLCTGILCVQLCVPVKNIGTFAESIKL